MIVGFLTATTVLLRLPFLAPRLAHWDAVNYALGLHEFNIAAHQPHPPGSPYFVLIGRAALMLVGDDNSALILVSLIASVGAVLAEYMLAWLLAGPRAALVAAVVLMTQPVFWGYGTIGTAWTLLTCLAVIIGTVCLLLVRGHARLAVPSGLILGIASGFRLDVTVFLLPLWTWGIIRAEPRWRHRIAASGLLAASVLLWLVPVAIDAGGIADWSARLVALLPSTDAAPAALARQSAANTVISFGTLAFTLGPAFMVSLALNRHACVCWMRTTLRSQMGIFWGLWIVPAFVFLWLVDSTEPGHDLVFTGALVAIGVGLLVHAASTMRSLAVGGALVVALQSAVFLFATPQYDRPLAWTMDSMLLNVTAPGLRQQQASLDSTLQIVRSQFHPDDSVVVTLTGQDPYRFMMYYLPEYVVLRLDPQTGSFLSARGRRQGNWIEQSDCLFAALVGSQSREGGVAHVRHGLWILSNPSEPGTVPEDATLVSPAGDPGPFRVWHVQLSPSAPDYLGFKLGGQCGAG